MSILDSASRKAPSLQEIMHPARRMGDEANISAATSAAALPTVAQNVPRVRRPGLGLRISERRVVLTLVDILLINSALIVATTLVGDFVPTVANIFAYSKWFIVLTIVWYGCALFFDCYDLARSASASISAKSALFAGLAAMLLYTFIPYFTPPLTSRGLIFYLTAFAVGSVVTWRIVYARVFVQPWFQQRALIIGAGKSGRALAAAIQAAPANDANPYRGTGYQIVGFIDDDAGLRGETIEGAPVLGDHRAMVQLAKALRVNEIILAITHRHAIADELFDALLHCREAGLRITPMATVYERLTGRLPIDHVGRDLETVLPTGDNAGERLYQLTKRLVDIVSAIVGLTLMSIMIIPIAIFNAKDSPGPLFYKQRRVGQGGKIIEVYKFRSMRPDAEEGTGAVWAKKNDDRITPIGRILRKTRLDEMPQFINVLKGEMSLIGPRPERPEFVNALSLMLPFYRARHAVKPGITGWAQIRYGYGSTNDDSHVKLEYDLYYVKHASPLLDTMIILQTVPVMLLGKGT